MHIRATTRAAANSIKVEALPDGKQLIKVYVTAVAEGGRANKAIIKLLAKALGIPASALTITHGLTTRDKTIAINTCFK